MRFGGVSYMGSFARRARTESRKNAVSVGVWHGLGRVSYRASLSIQERVAEDRARDARPDTLLLLEHPPTITLGRRSSESDLLRSRGELLAAGIGVERVRRGGRATYHGPGQLVGYPIVRLSRAGRGVREFVGAVEDMLVEVIAGFGVRAERRDGHPGAWVGSRKLASIGIEVRRGISRHGFALNVDMDLAPFRTIVPCGMPALEVADLSRAACRPISVASVAAAVVRAWPSRFGRMDEETLDGIEAAG